MFLLISSFLKANHYPNYFLFFISFDFYIFTVHLGFPRRLSGNESACRYRRCGRCEFDPWVGKILWNRKWQPTPIFLPGKFHGQRSLVGYSSWGSKELDMTEWLDTYIYVFLKAIVFHLFFFNWNIADLQCFAGFRYTAKWFSYTYMSLSVSLYRLLWDTESISLCYSVGLFCLPFI